MCLPWSSPFSYARSGLYLRQPCDFMNASLVGFCNSSDAIYQVFTWTWLCQSETWPCQSRDLPSVVGFGSLSPDVAMPIAMTDAMECCMLRKGTNRPCGLPLLGHSNIRVVGAGGHSLGIQGVVRQSVAMPTLDVCGYASMFLRQTVCCSVSDSGYL